MQVVAPHQACGSHSCAVTAAGACFSLCTATAPHCSCPSPAGGHPHPPGLQVRGDQTTLVSHPAGGWLLLLPQFDHRRPQLLRLLPCGQAEPGYSVPWQLSGRGLSVKPLHEMWIFAVLACCLYMVTGTLQEYNTKTWLLVSSENPKGLLGMPARCVTCLTWHAVKLQGASAVHAVCFRSFCCMLCRAAFFALLHELLAYNSWCG